MKLFFEEFSGYNPDVDAVASITLRVECAPGQVDALTGFLAAVASQAGVYSAAVGVDVHVPMTVEEEPPVVPAPAEPVLLPEPEPAIVAESELVVEGEVDGEQPLQQADPDGAGVDDGGQGSEAASGGEPELIDADSHGELAGPAGEVGAGSLERSA